jgi:hypothetical protein
VHSNPPILPRHPQPPYYSRSLRFGPTSIYLTGRQHSTFTVNHRRAGRLTARVLLKVRASPSRELRSDHPLGSWHMPTEPEADTAYRHDLESVRREIHFKWDGASKSEKQALVEEFKRRSGHFGLIVDVRFPLSNSLPLRDCLAGRPLLFANPLGDRSGEGIGPNY